MDTNNNKIDIRNLIDDTPITPENELIPRAEFRKWRDYSIADDNSNNENNSNDSSDYFEEYESDIEIVHMPHMHGPLSENIIDTSKMFNLYACNTNFYVTQTMKSRVCNVPGVETFDEISPYKFRIGVGELFIPDRVQNDIKKVLTQSLREIKKLK